MLHFMARGETSGLARFFPNRKRQPFRSFHVHLGPGSDREPQLSLSRLCVEFGHFRLLPKMSEAFSCHPTGLNTICFFLGSFLLSFNNQPRDR